MFNKLSLRQAQQELYKSVGTSNATEFRQALISRGLADISKVKLTSKKNLKKIAKQLAITVEVTPAYPEGALPESIEVTPGLEGMVQELTDRALKNVKAFPKVLNRFYDDLPQPKLFLDSELPIHGIEQLPAEPEVRLPVSEQQVQDDLERALTIKELKQSVYDLLGADTTAEVKAIAKVFYGVEGKASTKAYWSEVLAQCELHPITVQ